MKSVTVGWMILVALAMHGCRPSSPVAESPGRSERRTDAPKSRTQSPPPHVNAGAGGIRFRDVSDSTGITFVHASGFDAEKYFPTSLGSGVAMFDYDGDGKLDLYFCSARNLPLSAPTTAKGNRLYRNLGGWTFQDTTETAGVGYVGFCHGVAVGDVNGDGRPDLYLTNYGANVLYLNNGDGTFRDGSAASGARVNLWSNGAAILDYDNDGHLDLYVSCYGEWTDAGPHEYCGDQKRGLRVTCSPYSIRPQRHFLYKGRGDGTFEDTTRRAGILRRDGRGLGVISADVNRDGYADLYVANDASSNFLFLNRGDGTFEDVTETSGAATDGTGAVQGSMGADIQDVDGDGLPELFVTNFRGQYNTLYRNLDGRNFQDVSAQAGVIRDSLAYVGWGCSLADFDNDGGPDMIVVNGEIDDNLRSFGQEIDYEQPTVVWRNLGRGKFARVLDPGPFFARNHAGRGAAFGDLDDDGDLDMVINMMDRKPAILANETGNQGGWVRFVLEGSRGNREAIGATIDVHAGGRRFQRLVRGGDSYLSVNDRRILIGLGGIDRIDRVEICWPGGKKTTLRGVALGRTHRVVESSGDVVR